MKNTIRLSAPSVRVLSAALPVFFRATSESLQIRAENSVFPEPMEPMTRIRREGREKSKWLNERCTFTSGKPRLLRNALACELSRSDAIAAQDNATAMRSQRSRPANC